MNRLPDCNTHGSFIELKEYTEAMALRSDYVGQACSLARTLEIVGERWTLLIVRDAFYGVRRFSDFAAHLGIPRAVLAERLRSLAAAGVFAHLPDSGPGGEYELTPKGIALWPTIWALLSWGDENYAPSGPRRVFRHASDEAPLDSSGRCSQCGQPVDARDVLVAPGPGLADAPGGDDLVTMALRQPHRLLQPLRKPAEAPAG
jgi:DNA-binding HxlR family transcriptional regulator